MKVTGGNNGSPVRVTLFVSQLQESKYPARWQTFFSRWYNIYILVTCSMKAVLQGDDNGREETDGIEAPDTSCSMHPQLKHKKRILRSGNVRFISRIASVHAPKSEKRWLRARETDLPEMFPLSLVCFSYKKRKRARKGAMKESQFPRLANGGIPTAANAGGTRITRTTCPMLRIQMAFLRTRLLKNCIHTGGFYPRRAQESLFLVVAEMNGTRSVQCIFRRC